MLILLFMDGAVWALPKEEAVPGGMALVSLPGDLQGPVLYQEMKKHNRHASSYNAITAKP